MSNEVKCPACDSSAGLRSVAYAMAVLMQRLLDEGYIVSELRTDLRERASNLKRGRGFLTNADLESAPTPTPEEDLLS